MNVVQAMIDAGVVVVAAAGNQAELSCYRSPAAVVPAITVGNTRFDDSWSRSTNYGACVDVFVPGTDILSAGTDSPTASAVKTGTSMAAPRKFHLR
jgi:subtilisin family serine protease